MKNENEHEYDTEMEEALNRLREMKKAEIIEIDGRLKKMRGKIGDQLAILGLYSHRSIVMDHKGWDSVILKAKTKANELEAHYEAKKIDLERNRQELEFDLVSLNEILK